MHTDQMVDTHSAENGPAQLAVEGTPAFKERVTQLHDQERRRVCAQTDRLFMWLMLLQWVAGIAVAHIVSPTTWIGDTPHVHTHVYLAVFFGGLISVPPALLAWLYPGAPQTRLTIAIAQAVWSCLLIHLTGGRIETNFHAFASLAFLSFYREWRLLVINSVIVFLDHLVRGSLWPMAVYGVTVDSTYRLLELAMWLAWINVFLVKSSVQQLAGEYRSCERQAELERTNAVIGDRIEQRTSQLANANSQLQAEFEEHRKTQQQREHAFRELAQASRRAGMAEVATGVLHNVGNVLNSVNVSANMLLERNRKSRVTRLAEASDIICQHQSGLAEFLTGDSRGQHFPAVLKQLSSELLSEQEERETELASLRENLDHMHKVIDFQQTFAREKAVIEEFSIVEVVDDALKINAVDNVQQGFRLVRNYGQVPATTADKHKVLQVLINLISNARDSLTTSGNANGLLILTIEMVADAVRVHVTDNGVGVAKEDMDRIFTHGFSTKPAGHGFGLHSSALAAQTLGGSLSVQSEGVGQGATFTLAFPARRNQEALCTT